jgi:hypothetical protein
VFGAGRQILHSERADFILEILSDDPRVITRLF